MFMERKHIEYSKLPPPSRHIRHKFTIIKIEFVVFFPSISMNSQFFLLFFRDSEPTTKKPWKKKSSKFSPCWELLPKWDDFGVKRKCDRCEDPFGTFSANEKILVSFHLSFMSPWKEEIICSLDKLGRISSMIDRMCSCAALDFMMNFLDFSCSMLRRRQFFPLSFYNTFSRRKDMTTCTDAADEIYKQLLLIFPRFFIVFLSLSHLELMILTFMSL